jgi:hypothetical protein
LLSSLSVSWHPTNKDFCDGVVVLSEHLLGLSLRCRRTLGTIPSAQAEPGDDSALLPTCTRWAVYSRADSGPFPGDIERSLGNNDFREQRKVSRLTAGGGKGCMRARFCLFERDRVGELLWREDKSQSWGWNTRFAARSQRDADWIR